MGFRMINPKRVKKVKSKGAQEALDRLDAFLRSAEVTGEPVEILCRFWKDQQTAITYKELREAIIAGNLTNEILKQWSQDYSYLVKTKLSGIWTKAMKEGAANQPLVGSIAGGFTFNMQTPGALSWLSQKGAAFVTACTQQQKDAIAALVSKKMIDGHTVDELSRMIRPCIGLTAGDAKAAVRLYDSIVENLKKEHPRMKPESIRKKALDATQKYAERKHRARAMTIAQTESAFAYNWGEHEGILQAQAQGLIGTVKKHWSTSGDDGVCSICQSLEGMEVWMDAEFSFKGKLLFPGQHMLPPVHPRCACAIEYIEIEPPMFTEESSAERSFAGESVYDTIELSEEEQMAVNRYISSDAYVLNDKLRRKEALSGIEKAWVSNLDAALNKMPEYKGFVYRSLSNFGISDIEAFISLFVVGSQKVFSEYLSCSETVYDESFPIQFIILSKHGKDIREYNEAEKEILFKRDSIFWVTKVDGNLIYMEEA